MPHVIFATDRPIDEATRRPCGHFLKGWFGNHRLQCALQQGRNRQDRYAGVGHRNATLRQIYDELMPMFSDDGRFDPQPCGFTAILCQMKTCAENPT